MSRAFPFRASPPVLGFLFLSGVALTPAGAQPLDHLDIVVAVDNSGSMDLKVQEFESGLGDFAAALDLAGFDYRIILLTADSSHPRGVCAPAPLGSGSCPADENPPRYRHPAVEIGSTNSLQKMLDQHPTYAPWLRASSHRAMLVVTDDDSDLDGATFATLLITLDPGFSGFVFDAAALATEPVPPGLPGNPGICWRDGVPGFPAGAALGAEYLELVALRGGYFHDFCPSDAMDSAWTPFVSAIGLFVDGFETGDLSEWTSFAS
jgi:hypothetical protein